MQPFHDFEKWDIINSCFWKEEIFIQDAIKILARTIFHQRCVTLMKTLVFYLKLKY